MTRLDDSLQAHHDALMRRYARRASIALAVFGAVLAAAVVVFVPGV